MFSLKKLKVKNPCFLHILVTKVYLSKIICFFIQAGEGEDSYICRVVEMFEGVDGTSYFSAQWFYRAKDTVSFSLNYAS